MKTLTLLIIFLLMLSCNLSSKKESKPQLKNETIKKDSVATTLLITNDNIEAISLKDSLKTPIKVAVEKKVEKALVPNKTIAEPKKISKEIIVKEKPKTIDQKKAVEKEIVEKTEPFVEKKQVPIRPSHEIWDKLTSTYVASNGKVNYNGFKGALHNINDYLLHLQNTAPTKEWSKNEKLAYWFNLYNAATVHLVASNYPVKSIKDINDGKPWDKKFIKSGNQTYSLNDIENTVVRPNYNEPRLHVAFNCAAISCPNLLNEAFSPTKLNTQLNKLSKKWINDVSKNKITESEVQISQIFNWYGVDFKAGVLSFINTHSSVKANTNAKIIYKEYNWQLND